MAVRVTPIRFDHYCCTPIKATSLQAAARATSHTALPKPARKCSTTWEELPEISGIPEIRKGQAVHHRQEYRLEGPLE